MKNRFSTIEFSGSTTNPRFKTYFDMVKCFHFHVLCSFAFTTLPPICLARLLRTNLPCNTRAYIAAILPNECCATLTSFYGGGKMKEKKRLC